MAIVPCVKPLPRGFGGGKGERIAEKSLLHSLLWKTRIAPAVLAFSIRSLLLHTFSIPMSARKRICLSPKLGKKTSPSAWHIPSASQRASQRRRLHCMNRASASRTRLRPGMALRGAGDGAPWFFPGRLVKKRVLTCCISTLFFAGMNFLILRLKRAGDSAPF